MNVAEIQSTCIPDEQLVSGDMCPGVNAALINVRRSDAERMLFEEVSEARYQAEAVDVATGEGRVDRQPAEVPETGGVRSVRCTEDDGQVTTARPVDEHAAAALSFAAVSRCP